MKRWTMALAIVATLLMVSTAEAGRRCGGRHRRARCGGGCGSACGYVAPAPCAGGACSVGYATPGYPAYADWTSGYPGVGYTGYGYTAFAGYAPGAFYYGGSGSR